MTTQVEKTILVDVPVSTAYNQWTQFEEFPEFMGGVQEVRQLDDKRLHWVVQIAGVKREWDATILEQVPDHKIAWAATEGATNAGAVYFEPVGAGQTLVRLSLEYEPEGVVEKVGDKLNVVEKRAEADLAKFKQFIESRGSESGGWRGSVGEGSSVGTPGVEAAQSSRGDSGKAGLSAKTVAAGAAAAAAGIAAASALKGGKSDTESDEVSEQTTYTTAEEVTDVPVRDTADVDVETYDADTEVPRPGTTYTTGYGSSTTDTTIDEGRTL